MGKRKITSDITEKAKSLNLRLDLSNLPDIEDIGPHLSRDKVGATFNLSSIPEDEAVSFASEDGEFSSEFTGEDSWSEREWNEVFVLDALGEQEFIDFE